MSIDESRGVKSTSLFFSPAPRTGNAYQRLGNAPEQQRLLERAQSIAETLPGHQVGCQQRPGMGLYHQGKNMKSVIFGDCLSGLISQ